MDTCPNPDTREEVPMHWIRSDDFNTIAVSVDPDSLRALMRDVWEVGTPDGQCGCI